MTTDTADIAQPAVIAVDAPDRSSRTFAQQAVIDTLSRPAAWFGLSWIGLLLLAAVFAPFIASSFPLLVKEQGHWHSPVLLHLAPADVAWLAGFLTASVLAILRKTTFLQSVAITVWLIVVIFPLTILPAIVHDKWLPGADTLGRGFGWSVIGIAGVIDLLLLVGIPSVVKMKKSIRLVVAGFAGVIVALLLVFPVRPPEAIVYEQFRLKHSAGEMQLVVHAVIPYSPNDYERDKPNARLQSPSAEHIMGTEQSGADVFSRMLHASRISLSIGFIATGIAVVIAIFVGGTMGYFAGSVDIIGMRFIEILEAVPTLILLLTVCAFFGRNLYLMMLIIGLLSWTGDARFIRAEFFRLRKQDFVQAAIASGLPLRSIIFRHMLPNGITPVLVNTSFNVASAILYESILSFLGMGLVDEPSWGQLLNQARAGGTGFQWWIATFPGIAIFLTVFAYNLIGEAARDAIDPRLRKRD